MGRIQYQGKVQTEVYASEMGGNILGWPAQKSLGICLDPNVCPPIQINNPRIQFGD